MKRRGDSRAVLLLSLLAFLFAVCGDDDGAGPTGEAIKLPLAVGNTWIYAVTTDEEKTATIDTSTIVGTESRDGTSWYVFYDHGDKESTLARQEGPCVYVIPPAPEDDPEMEDDPVADYLRAVLARSLPWKYADFGAASGTAWTLIDAETTFAMIVGDISGPTDTLDLDVEILFRAMSRGRASVTVPAGAYPDAYRGEITQRLLFSYPELSRVDSMTVVRTLYAADGVGIVKTEEVTDDPFEQVAETVVERLTSYGLE